MNILVVYDSLFGNTKVIAGAIAEGLGSLDYAINIKEVTPKQLQSAELLVLGCPVQNKKPSVNTLNFLKDLKDGATKAYVTAFDTRYATIFAGSATGTVLAGLKKAGGKNFSDPKHFIVLEKSGPLLAHQVNLARAWGMDLKEKLSEIAAPAKR